MMPDLEKVIRALECCNDHGEPDCDECPYMDDDLLGTCESRNNLFRDAAELLKRQRAVEPDVSDKDDIVVFYRCGVCGTEFVNGSAIHKLADYCPNCGKAVKKNES